MDAYDTDVRAAARPTCARSARPAPRPDGRLPGLRVRRADRRRPGRRHPGRLEAEELRLQTRRRGDDRRRPADSLTRSNRLGADPRNTNYAGGNTSAKGTATDPVTGAAGRAAVGQGLRRRPRHADRGRARRAAAGPAARAGRRLPGRGARGRDGRRVRLLPARQGRRGAVDRHRHARAGRRRRTSTTCTPTPGSRSPPRPTARSSPRSASATGSSGCRGGARASSSASTSPRSRRRTRRRSACVLGGHGITAWGDDQRGGEANSLEIIRTAQAYLDEHGAAEPFGAVVPGNEPLPEAERRAKAAALSPTSAGSPPPTGRRSATSPTATRCWTSSPARSSRRSPSWARPARTTSCAPRSSRWWSTCRGTRRSRRSSPGCGSCTPPTGRTTAAYYERHADPDSPPMRGADPAIVLVPGVGHVLLRRATSRPPGWRASSTSTRST